MDELINNIITGEEKTRYLAGLSVIQCFVKCVYVLQYIKYM